MEPSVKQRNQNWGLLFIVYALFQFVVFCAGLYMTTLAAAGTFAAQGSDDLTGYTVTVVIGFAAMLSTPVILLLGLASGIGLRGQRKWARGVALATAILALLQFPVGTIFGALALRFLFTPDIKTFFH